MSDEQLIYLIKECHNKQAFDILYNKYFDDVLIGTSGHVFKKFYNLPLDKDDLITECYFSFLTAIKAYNYKRYKLSFLKFLYLIVRNNFFGLAKKNILLKNNKFYNEFISFTKFDQMDYIKEAADLDIEQQVIEEFEKKEIFLKIKNMQEKHPKQHLSYSTLLLRLEGYSVDEICQELKVTKRFVFNSYNFLIKKIRNELKEELLEQNIVELKA